MQLVAAGVRSTQAGLQRDFLAELIRLVHWDGFTIEEAAQLSEDIGAEWLVPMHYDMFTFDTVDVNRFIDHMLFSRPRQRFKVFECGAQWAIPED